MAHMKLAPTTSNEAYFTTASWPSGRGEAFIEVSGDIITLYTFMTSQFVVGGGTKQLLQDMG